MLIWTALHLSQNKNTNLKTYIGIPYNPYYPNPYKRSFVWDNCHKTEVLVQEDLWSMFAGEDVFEELIAAFKVVGKEMKVEIDQFLQKNRH